MPLNEPWNDLLTKLITRMLCKTFAVRLFQNIPQLLFVLLFEGCFLNQNINVAILISIVLYIAIVNILCSIDRSKAFLIVLGISQIAVCTLLFLKFRVDPNLYPNDPRDYNRLGKNLFRYGVYTNYVAGDGSNLAVGEASPKEPVFSGNFNDSLKRTTYRPVGYPLFIAFVYTVTGTADYKAVLLTQYLLYMATTLLLWKFVRNITNEDIAGVVVTIYQFNLPLLFLANSFWTETLAQFLFMVSIYCIKGFGGEKPKLMHNVTLGIAGGFLILVRPVFLIYFPFVVLGYCLHWLVGKKIQPKQLLGLMLLVGIPLAWAVRNTYLAGRITSFSTNGGINIFLGNNPYVINGRASNWPPKSYVDGVLEGLGNTEQSGKHYKAFLESETDARFQKTGIGWIVETPQRFLSLAASKLEYIFLPIGDLSANMQHFNSPAGYQYALILLVQSVVFWLLLLFTVFGLVDRRTLPFSLISLPYIVLLLLNFGQDRFQVPLYIPMAYTATIGLTKIIAFIKGKRWLVIVPVWKIFLYFTLLVALAWHFNYFNDTLLGPYKTYIYEAKTANALESVEKDNNTLFVTEPSLSKNPDNEIIKKYTEDRYLDAYLYYKDKILTTPELLELIEKKKILTADLDIFNRLDMPGVREGVMLQYENAVNDTPVVSLKNKKILEGLQTVEIMATSPIDIPSQKVFLMKNKEIDPKVKYIGFTLHIEKNSYIDIIGNKKIRIKPYTKVDGRIDTEIYFPAIFFSSGATVSGVNNTLPTFSHNISMDIDNRYTWSAGNVQVVRIITYQ